MSASTDRQTVEVNGFALRAWRTQRGLSAKQVAEATGTGMDRSRIAQIEGDHHRRVRPDLLHALAGALDIDARALLVNPYEEVAA